MSKSTNVSVSMSPQCARAWRRLERSFEGDGAMLPRDGARPGGRV